MTNYRAPGKISIESPLGDASSIPALKSLTLSSKKYQEEAIRIAVSRMSAKDGQRWLNELAQKPETVRLAIIGAGVAGDSVLVPWLIEQMKTPGLARVAGEAFALITGVDISHEGLEGRKPEGFTSGPNDDPDDTNVKMDTDDGLPWPDVEAIKGCWNKQRDCYKNGGCCFIGKPVSKEHFQDVLGSGFQRQRQAAAVKLAIMYPGKPLFDVYA